jgi:hypothetical protein
MKGSGYFLFISLTNSSRVHNLHRWSSLWHSTSTCTYALLHRKVKWSTDWDSIDSWPAESCDIVHSQSRDKAEERWTGRVINFSCFIPLWWNRCFLVSQNKLVFVFNCVISLRQLFIAVRSGMQLFQVESTLDMVGACRCNMTSIAHCWVTNIYVNVLSWWIWFVMISVQVVFVCCWGGWNARSPCRGLPKCVKCIMYGVCWGKIAGYSPLQGNPQITCP